MRWPHRFRVAKVTPPQAPRLPWWGLLLTSADRHVIGNLLASGQRLTALMRQPGWADVEAVIQDWLLRYAEEAGRLGQQMEDQQGRLVLREQDTPQDDRRRLIAGAQAAALKGLLAELRHRAQAETIWDTRQRRGHEDREEANQSLV